MQSLYQRRTDPLYQYTRQHASAYRRLELAVWALALFFGLGDVVTTLVAVTPVFVPAHPALYESVAVTRWILDAFGPFALFPKKALVLGAVAVVWRVFPRPYRVLLPAGATIGNYLLFSGNLRLILEYGLFGLPF